MGYKLNIHNGHLCSKTHCVEMTYGLVLRRHAIWTRGAQNIGEYMVEALVLGMGRKRSYVRTRHGH